MNRAVIKRTQTGYDKEGEHAVNTARVSRSIIIRLKDSRAFTLAEALIAVIIMLLVTGIVVAGIPAAVRAYNRVVTASNAEVLLSTTMSALRNELTLAKDIDIQAADNGYVSAVDGVKSGVKIIYYNPQTGAKSRLSKGDDDIMYERYAADEILIDSSELVAGSDAAKAYAESPVNFMSDEISDKDKNLHINYTSVSYNEKTGIVKFDGLSVSKDGNPTLAVIGTYSIRIIAE